MIPFEETSPKLFEILEDTIKVPHKRSFTGIGKCKYYNNSPIAIILNTVPTHDPRQTQTILFVAAVTAVDIKTRAAVTNDL